MVKNVVASGPLLSEEQQGLLLQQDIWLFHYYLKHKVTSILGPWSITKQRRKFHTKKQMLHKAGLLTGPRNYLPEDLSFHIFPFNNAGKLLRFSST